MATKKKAASQYTVKKGDTLSGIAAANNMSLADIRKANPQMTAPGSKYKNGNMIWSGTNVNLSAGGGRGAGMSPAGNKPRKSGNTLLGKIGSVVGAIGGGIGGAVLPGVSVAGGAKYGSKTLNKVGNDVSPNISKKQFGTAAGIAGGIAAGGIIGAARGLPAGPMGAAVGGAAGIAGGLARTNAGRAAGKVAGGALGGAAKGMLKAGPVGGAAGAAIGGTKAAQGLGKMGSLGSGSMGAGRKAGAAAGALGGAAIGGMAGSMIGGSKKYPGAITADIKNKNNPLSKAQPAVKKSFGGAAQTMPKKAGATGTIQNMPNTPQTAASGTIQQLGTAKMKKINSMTQAV
jgi:hypothetical protein